MKDVRTWIEIDAKALRHNAEQFLKLIPKSTRLMAVIKSNAYGHGLVLVARELADVKFRAASSQKPSASAQPLWFGVDSITEALRLRREGIENQILVLGYTLPSRISEAGANGIALTVSSFDSLKAISGMKKRPPAHIKIDTGMHRQGFLPRDTPALIRNLRQAKISPHGVYTHFASAKDPRDRAYTIRQIREFSHVIDQFGAAGIDTGVRHAASSGATLLFPESHLDMVRIGMGLYGYWPSQESKVKEKELGARLQPILTWKTIVSEVKEIPRGALVGYDGTERVGRVTKIAVLPIGYWHGYDRGLSGAGEVLIRGSRCKILGRVSMDMLVVDTTDAPRVHTGDDAVLIGKQGKEFISAEELGDKIETSAYEFLTRINPLIRRIIVH